VEGKEWIAKGKEWL